MAEKFFNTYIRIDTPSYYNNNSYGCGFETVEQKQNYNNEKKPWNGILILRLMDNKNNHNHFFEYPNFSFTKLITNF